MSLKYGTIMKDVRTYNLNTQKTMGEILKVKEKTYSFYERQIRIIPIIKLNIFCNYFNISIDYVLGLTNKMSYQNSKNNINKKLIGKRLKELRTENNTTQKELADFLKTSHSTISAYESGKTLILTSFLYQICKKYNISSDYLLGKIDSPKNI